MLDKLILNSTLLSTLSAKRNILVSSGNLVNNETDIKAQFGYFKFKDLSKVLTSYRKLKSGVLRQNQIGGDFFSL